MEKIMKDKKQSPTITNLNIVINNLDNDEGMLLGWWIIFFIISILVTPMTYEMFLVHAMNLDINEMPFWMYLFPIVSVTLLELIVLFKSVDCHVSDPCATIVYSFFFNMGIILVNIFSIMISHPL